MKELTLKTIISLFGIFSAINLIIIIFAHLFVPYSGFFPYKEIATQFGLPFFLNSLANFDGVQYLIIAKEGYFTYNQAYFPLFPLIIRFFSPIFLGNYLLDAIVVSNIFLLGAFFVFVKYLEAIHIDKKIIFWIIILLLAFPTSFFFNTVYTESLFFLLLTLSLYFFKKENYILSFIFSVLCGLTRVTGIFLVIPFFVEAFFLFKKRKPIKPFLVANIFAPILGLSIYSFYLFKTTGDWLFFFHSQSAFGANRSTHLILLPQVAVRYIRIFTTSSFNFQYFISCVEFVSFFFVFSILLYQLYDFFKNRKKRFSSDLLGLNLFSIAVLLLPTLTGTFSSVPRYALLCISFFLILAQVKNKYFLFLTVLLFVILHILLLGFFAQGYFVS